MFLGVSLAGMRALLDRGVLGGEAERVEPHGAHDDEPVTAAEVRDDVAQHVVADMPHVEVAGRIREHLEDVGLPGVALELVGVRIRHLEGTLVLPDALPLLFDRSWVVLLHRRSLFASDNKKASRARGSRGTPAALAAPAPCVMEEAAPSSKRVTGKIGSAGFLARSLPGFGADRARRARARRHRRIRARRALRDAARRLLRGHPSEAGPCAPNGRGGGRARLLRHEGVPERRAAAALSRGRDRRRRRRGRRARVRARGRALGRPSSSCTGTTRTRRFSPTRPPRAPRWCWTHPTRPRSRQRQACDERSSA